MNETLAEKKSPFDYRRFMEAVNVLRKHHGIENVHQLSKIIGVNHGSLYAMAEGKAVDSATLFAIVHWSKIDIRDYMTDYVAPKFNGNGAATE